MFINHEKLTFKIKNFWDNNDVKVISQEKGFTVIEYQKDLSVTPDSAQIAYFSGLMDIRRKTLMCDLKVSDVTIQPGAMQFMVGDVQATTGIKGAGDFLKKSFMAKASGESTIKPEYTGTGVLVLEPTFKHIILTDLVNWNGGMVIDDGLFMACESHIKQSIVARTNLSSAIAGQEGFFNLSFSAPGGVVALECDVPQKELIAVELNNDVIKIDGNMAIAWSKSLEFTVERSGKTLIGSAASGEGLVNVYRGTGRILLKPVGGITGISDVVFPKSQK